MKPITERAAEVVAKHAKTLDVEVIKLVFELIAEVESMQRSAQPPILSWREWVTGLGTFTFDEEPPR